MDLREILIAGTMIVCQVGPFSAPAAGGRVLHNISRCSLQEEDSMRMTKIQQFSATTSALCSPS